MTDETPEQRPDDREEAAVRPNPATNTSPPSNPPVDQEDVEKGEEKLNRIVD